MNKERIKILHVQSLALQNLHNSGASGAVAEATQAVVTAVPTKIAEATRVATEVATQTSPSSPVPFLLFVAGCVGFILTSAAVVDYIGWSKSYEGRVEIRKLQAQKNAKKAAKQQIKAQRRQKVREI